MAPTPSVTRLALRALLLAAAYFAVATLSLQAAVAQHVVSSVWPPAGLALAALLLFGPGLWPGVALGAFAVNAASGVPVTGALLIASGNTLAAAFGTAALRRAGFDPALARLRDVLMLAGLGALAAPAVAATLGVAGLVTSGDVAAGRYGGLWVVWWSGDGLGVLIGAPLLLTWWRHAAFARRAPRALEAALLLAALVGLTFALFQTPFSYVYAIFPVAGWAAIRFGPRGAASATALVAAQAVWHTLRDRGPFSASTPMNDLVLLQIFLALLAVTTLALAAVIAERARAEQRRADVEQQLTDAQAIAGLGSWQWDVAANTLTWSDELCRIYGIAPGEAPPTFEGFLARVAPEDRDHVATTIQAALRERTPFRFQERIVLPDGTVRVLDSAGAPLLNGGGTLVGMRGTCYDVTELKRAEAELRASEQRLRLLLENVQDYAIVMLDPSGFVTGWYGDAERVKGWSAEDIVGRDFRAFYAAEDQARGRPETNLRAAAEQGWHEDEGWRLRKDGTRFWASVTITAVRDGAGTLIGFAKVTRDLTERRNAEHALREREGLLAATFDRTAVGIALSDVATGQFFRVNRRFAQMLGYTDVELLAASLETIVVGPDWPRTRELLHELFDGRRESVQLEQRLYKKHGEVIWVRNTMSVIPGAGDASASLISIAEDITAHHAVEEELRAYRFQLRALSQKLLGGQEAERTRIARELHDQIGQALGAVMMSLEAMLRPAGAERRKTQVIHDAMATVERAIEQVRTLSFDLRPSMLDDLGLAAAVAAHCRRAARAAGVTLDLKIADIEGPLPKVAEVACFRILQEAFANALRYAEASTIEVRLSGDAKRLSLAVEDNGRGFDTGAALKPTPSDFRLGILGMKERAELAGGRVSVESKPGRGTIVRAMFYFDEGAAHGA